MNEVKFERWKDKKEGVTKGSKNETRKSKNIKGKRNQKKKKGK